MRLKWTEVNSQDQYSYEQKIKQEATMWISKIVIWQHCKCILVLKQQESKSNRIKIVFVFIFATTKTKDDNTNTKKFRLYNQKKK